MYLEALVSSKITVLAIPVFFAAIAMETIAVRVFKARGSMDTKDDLVSIFLGLMSVVTNGAVAFLTVGMLFWAAQYRIATIPLSIVSVIACFVIDHRTTFIFLQQVQAGSAFILSSENCSAR